MFDLIGQFIAHVISIVASIDGHTWALIGAVLGVSTFQEAIKQWLGTHARTLNDRTSLLFTFALSSIPASIDYASNFAAQNPGVLPGKVLLVFGATQPAYRFVVKPVFNYVLGVLRDAREYRKSLESNVVPAPAQIDV